MTQPLPTYLVGNKWIYWLLLLPGNQCYTCVHFLCSGCNAVWCSAVATTSGRYVGAQVVSSSAVATLPSGTLTGYLFRI